MSCCFHLRMFYLHSVCSFLLFRHDRITGIQLTSFIEVTLYIFFDYGRSINNLVKTELQVRVTTKELCKSRKDSFYVVFL